MLGGGHNWQESMLSRRARLTEQHAQQGGTFGRTVCSAGRARLAKQYAQQRSSVDRAIISREDTIGRTTSLVILKHL
eukprot:1155018-Pelagomonas_calceolata.AAC.3